MNSKEIIERLDENDIIEILVKLGSEEPIETNDNLIFSSVCHGSDSMKLYYYKDSKKFYCYSHCSSLSLFDVVMRALDCDFKSAISFIEDTCYIYKPRHGVKGKHKYITKTLDEIEIPEVESCKKQFVYDIFSKDEIKAWSDEGISYKTQQKFKIRYDRVGDRAIIPTFDINDKLVGVRVRNFNPLEILKKSKYHPLWYKDLCYNFPTKAILYGLNLNKENIKKYKKVVVFESEKSVMMYNDIYPRSNIAVAMFGSNFTDIHKKILLSLGVEEIVLAMDKEFQEYGSDEYKEYEKKIIKNFRGLEGICRCSYIIDKCNKLELKDSPIDKGRGIFEELIKERIYI